MPDDGVIQLRRNPSKQMLARPHMSKHSKANKTGNTRGSKLPNSSNRKIHGLNHSHSGSSLNHADHSEAPHVHLTKNNGSSHRLNRSANVTGSTQFGSNRHRGLAGGLGNLAHSYRKPIIQLEREDDDGDDDDDDNYDNDDDYAEFEDLEDDDDNDIPKERPPPPDRSDSQLSIGIQPVEPTPPKLSEETVISVSSLADMASALKGARDKSGFVGTDDLISTAVNRSKNLGNMAQMVQGWNSAAQRSSKPPKKKAQADRTKRGSSASITGDEDPREYEKVFREYTNTRAISNPVISSLYRISLSSDSMEGSGSGNSSSTASINGEGNGAFNGHIPPRFQLPSVKKVNSLVATTANQMSDYSEHSGHTRFPERYASPQSHGAIESVSTYTLNKIWQSGWEDSDYPSGHAKLPAQLPRGIQSQAMRVQQQLASQRDKRGSSIRLAQ